MKHRRKVGPFGTPARNAAAAALALAVVATVFGSIAFASQELMASGGSSEARTAVQEQSPAKAVVEKSEVVYGMLGADGSVHDAYVVNRFASDAPCDVEDYGAYAQVTNLSTTQPLVLEDGKVAFEVGEEPFFYQGMLTDAQLPWNVRLSYTLDGRTVAPAELAGASGRLGISLHTSKNARVNPVFYESFVLQVTFTLDGDHCKDIQAEGATLAASGKDMTVAYTVLPGHDGSFELLAQVEDFELASTQIAALPYSSVIDMPDTSEMESGLSELSSAVSQLNAGTSELAQGAAQLSSGADSLASGSGEFGDGLAKLASSSSQIVGASKQIDDAMTQIARALEDVDLTGIDGLEEYAPFLRETAQTLSSLKSVIQEVDQGYTRTAAVLDALASVVHENALTEEQIAALRTEVADNPEAAASLERLLATYFAAQKAIDDYYAGGGSPATIAAQLEALLADGGEFDQVVSALYGAADFLENGGIDQLKQMVTGLSELAGNYSQFHSGLVSYTQGVQALSDNYGKLSSGVSQLASGTSQLSSGASQLSSGVAQFAAATGNLPAQMKERMGELMADYEFPEFEPVSFVDERNEDVALVQFILFADAIEKPVPEAAEPEPEQELTAWDRFLALLPS